MAELSTTIVVQFSDDDTEGGYIAAEVDSRADGLNDGNTSFVPGDIIFFLVFLNSKTDVEQVITSGGSVNLSSSFNIQYEEFVTFDNKRGASIAHPALAINSFEWYGNNLGNITIANDEVSLIIGEKGVGVAKVTYTSKVYAYDLASPLVMNGETKFQIVVVVIGKLK